MSTNVITFKSLKIKIKADTNVNIKYNIIISNESNCHSIAAIALRELIQCIHVLPKRLKEDCNP